MRAEGVSSAGNSRGLIEARALQAPPVTDPHHSSAGNSRGLIEAREAIAGSRRHCFLPRVTPAASLKRGGDDAKRTLSMGSSAGNSRGLIEAASSRTTLRVPTSSSAGNSRGLIEATSPSPTRTRRSVLPRVTPAASLKPPRRRGRRGRCGAVLPRVTPAASLKPYGMTAMCPALPFLPRVTPAASLKRVLRLQLPHRLPRFLPRVTPAASLKRAGAGCSPPTRRPSSAGNSRGLIEARLPWV